MFMQEDRGSWVTNLDVNAVCDTIQQYDMTGTSASGFLEDPVPEQAHRNLRQLRVSVRGKRVLLSLGH
jgi:hypothetical protein